MRRNKLKHLSSISSERENLPFLAFMKKIFILLVLFLNGLLTGCVSIDTVASNNVNPSTIYQGYTIAGNSKETKLYAFFRVGGSVGTTVELVAPSRIQYNGEDLMKSEPNFLKGTSYVASASGYQPKHEILFSDSEGKNYRYNMTLEAIEFQPKSAVVLKRSQQNFISLSRVPIDSSEKIEIVLTNEEFQSHEKNKVSIDLPQTFDPMKNVLIISPETLKKFPNGTATIVMTSSKSVSLEQFSKIGGNFTVNYEAEHLKIQINN